MLTTDILSLLVLLLFTATLLLPRRITFFCNGSMLLLLGCSAVAYLYGYSNFDPFIIPAFSYLLVLIGVFGGRELLIEGFREQPSLLRTLSITVGLLLVLTVTIPQMYSLGALSFTLPFISPLILYAVHGLGGFLLLIGSFVFDEKNV